MIQGAPHTSPSGNVYSGEQSDRLCLHCETRQARLPYDYCGPCTVEAHVIMRQAQRRNALTKPPVQVYRWDTDAHKWVLRGTDEVVEP